MSSKDMTHVTHQMISAAHGATIARGIVLSHEILTNIYLAMDSMANHKKTSGSPWVGVTDDEISEISRCCVKAGGSVNHALRSLEAKLKERNT